MQSNCFAKLISSGKGKLNSKIRIIVWKILASLSKKSQKTYIPIKNFWIGKECRRNMPSARKSKHFVFLKITIICFIPLRKHSKM